MSLFIYRDSQIPDHWDIERDGTNGYRRRMTKKKPAHGGARPNAGRPPSTGMASTPPIHFRVSASQHAELTREGRKARLSANQVAKRRCFEAVRGTTKEGQP